MHPFVKLIRKREKLVVGLISGTSMDGIDAALVQIRNHGKDTEVNLINFYTFSFPHQLKKELLRISEPGCGTVDQICRLNFVIGEYFADAVFDICNLAKLNDSKVDLIGSHGQTIHHLPDRKKCFNKSIRSTFQIGEPAVIANRTGVITVANFRSADIALNGQGAPLIPYFDYLMFNSEKFNRVLLNIGGIANITILPKNSSINEVLAYDTGPGNMVINALMRKFYHSAYDKDGRIAMSGEISEQMLLKLLQHPFFNKPIPKSTGREEFGDLFIKQILELNEELKLKPEDIIATVTELTTYSITEALKFSHLPIEQVDQLIVSGGGIHNASILKSLKNNFSGSDILTSDYFNVPGDAKEAMCFAVLANEAISATPANLPSVTGAKSPTILGTICMVGGC